MTRIRHTFAAASVLALALGLTGCMDSNDEGLVLSDSQLLQSEACDPERGDARDDATDCERTRDGRAHVRVARDVRPDRDLDCSDLRGSDRYIFRRFARRCVVVDRVGRDSVTCDTVLCAEGTICVDSRDGFPMCRDNPRIDCTSDRDCGDAVCIENMCARQPHRDDVATDRRITRDRPNVRDLGDDVRRDRRSDRPSDRHTDRRITDERPRVRDLSDAVRDRRRRHHDRVTDRAHDRRRVSDVRDRVSDRVTDRVTDRADHD